MLPPGDDGGGSSSGSGGGGSSSSSGYTGTAATTISSDGTYSGTSYDSSTSDENALLIDGATVTLEDITVDTEAGDFYGMNAAILALNGANVTISGADVTTNASGGNGVYNYGESVITISDSTISTSQNNSGGIMVTGGGTLYTYDLDITTQGSSAAAIRSDRGGGTIVVDGGTYTTYGYNSPAVYSTADITVSNAELTANNSEAIVVEGDNSVTLENCDVYGNIDDEKGTSSDENVHTIFIYQSQSGDADEGTSSFSMTGGTLTSNNGDVIHVTNTACTIYLSGVEITNNETADGYYFLSVLGNDASHGWGTAGSNGGNVEFIVDGQVFEGDIVVDTISTLDMTLENGSYFTGTINIVENAEGGTAVSNNAVVTIDETSTWELTGDCTITSLENYGTIIYNGYTITLVDGTVLSEDSTSTTTTTTTTVTDDNETTTTTATTDATSDSNDTTVTSEDDRPTPPDSTSDSTDSTDTTETTTTASGTSDSDNLSSETTMTTNDRPTPPDPTSDSTDSSDTTKTTTTDSTLDSDDSSSETTTTTDDRPTPPDSTTDDTNSTDSSETTTTNSGMDSTTETGSGTTSITTTTATTSTTADDGDSFATTIGDVNLDGTVSLADVIKLNKYVSGSVSLTDEAWYNADVNESNSVDGDDALILLKFQVQLIDALPYTE